MLERESGGGDLNSRGKGVRELLVIHLAQGNGVDVRIEKVGELGKKGKVQSEEGRQGQKILEGE